MNKPGLLLLINGVPIAIGLVFFLRWYLNKNESHFRDDHWSRTPRAKLKQITEDKRDAQILLEFQSSEAPREEPEPSPNHAFRSPNFRGQPHEVLGVAPDSDEATINAAFRHWMKRFHPDRVTHLGPEYVEQARRRAEQLNTARAALLKRFQ